MDKEWISAIQSECSTTPLHTHRKHGKPHILYCQNPDFPDYRKNTHL